MNAQIEAQERFEEEHEDEPEVLQGVVKMVNVPRGFRFML